MAYEDDINRARRKSRNYDKQEIVDVEKYRRDVREKYEKEFRNKEKKNQLDLIDQEYKRKKLLDSANLTYNVKEQEKYLKLLAKQEEIERLKVLTSLHEEEKKQEKELQEQRLAYLKSVVEDENASKEQKEAAQKELNEEFIKKLENTIVNNLVNKLSELNSSISKYAEYQSDVNTRVQGAGLLKRFSSMETMINNAVGITPYLQNQKMMDNLVSMIDQGILYNVEQRAFLQTISDNIATTFDAANGTLLRLVKLQQDDSTASRLGMEAYINQFLNKLFQTTDYLGTSSGGGLADTVSSALIEATSQMTSKQAVEFEYIVQKWLGSLSSVGLSDASVSSIAQAIGYLGSGNIAALSQDIGMQNLIVMSASRAGLDYGQLLTEGLNSSNINELMEAIVQYLQEISYSNNQVIKSSYANIFGVNISDLTAAVNLTSENIKEIAKSQLTYSDSIKELTRQMNLIPTRLSSGEMMENLLANLEYGLASSVAKNPVTQALWSVTNLIQGTTGGINIPTISVMGTSIDLETTAENLMRLGIVGISSLGMVGEALSGLSSTLVPSTMFTKMSAIQSLSNLLSQSPTVGYGLSSTTSGQTTSISAGSGQDIYTSTLESSRREANEQMEIEKTNQQQSVNSILVTDEGEKQNIITTISDNIFSIYDLLNKVATGEALFSVRLSDNIFSDSLSDKASTL